MTLDEIKQALNDLTRERRRGVDTETMHVFRSMTPKKPPRITENELDQREKDLEGRLGDWWVIWDQTNQSYGIVPREE